MKYYFNIKRLKSQQSMKHFFKLKNLPKFVIIIIYYFFNKTYILHFYKLITKNITKMKDKMTFAEKQNN